MGENYIKQVKRELRLSPKVRREIVRDLNEIFASAMEHGETEAAVIQRLGPPKEFADSAARQFGVDTAAVRRRARGIFGGAALATAVAAFAVYAVISVGRVPAGAIGHADVMTTMQVEGAAVDLAQIILLVGAMAAVFAVATLLQIVCDNRRSR